MKKGREGGRDEVRGEEKGMGSGNRLGRHNGLTLSGRLAGRRRVCYGKFGWGWVLVKRRGVEWS